VIKKGEVDLYMVREEKRVVVERLGKGQCFGMTPHLPKSTRINNATVESQLKATSELGHSLLQTLSDRLSVAHELVATRVNYQPDLLVCAQLLLLLGMAEIGKATALARHLAPGAQPPSARVLLQDVVHNARLMFGHSDKHISGVLAKLINLHLVHIEDDGNGKRVQCVPRDIVSQARKVATNGVDQDKSSHEYLSVDEFAGLVEVDRQVRLKKLAGGDFADDIFTFRRAEIIRLLNDKGKRFFAERKIKAPADFSEVADMGPVDPVEVQQLGNGLVREVRELMTAGR
jgi:CRP-like cAMP-binding protein